MKLNSQSTDAIQATPRELLEILVSQVTRLRVKRFQ